MIGDNIWTKYLKTLNKKPIKSNRYKGMMKFRLTQAIKTTFTEITTSLKCLCLMINQRATFSKESMAFSDLHKLIANLLLVYNLIVKKQRKNTHNLVRKRRWAHSWPQAFICLIEMGRGEQRQHLYTCNQLWLKNIKRKSSNLSCKFKIQKSFSIWWFMT